MLDAVKKLNETTFGVSRGEWGDIEIGDIKQPLFSPQIKMKRWDNEVNFSVRLIDNDASLPIVKAVGGEIQYIKEKIEVHFYDLQKSEEYREGGYEFEVILKEKPVTNKIKFTLQDKDVAYYYQPPLTQKEIDEGCERPENVVGSYAVYAKTPKTNWEGGKLYRAGKVGHIYRPRITDAKGDWAWGKLNISDGILTITIDQTWLNDAVYPVKVDPTFGYEVAGASSSYLSAYDGSDLYQTPRGSHFVGAAGTADSISAYLKTYTQTIYASGGIYADTSLVRQTEITQLATSTTAWRTWDFSSPPAISAIDYVLVAQQGSDSYYIAFYYDDGSANQGEYATDRVVGDTLPSTIAWTDDGTKKYSIYCTYTAGPTFVPRIIII